MTDDGDDLLPCPFCGGKPEVIRHFKEEMWRLLHRCDAVGPITMDWTEKDRLAKRWNRRTSDE